MTRLSPLWATPSSAPLPSVIHKREWHTPGGKRMLLHGSAKATTAFGPLAGQTAISVTEFGDDSALIEFMCGSTPVMLAVAGDHYLKFVQALIEHASPAHRQQLEADLHAALALEEAAA